MIVVDIISWGLMLAGASFRSLAELESFACPNFLRGSMVPGSPTQWVLARF